MSAILYGLTAYGEGEQGNASPTLLAIGIDERSGSLWFAYMQSLWRVWNLNAYECTSLADPDSGPNIGHIRAGSRVSTSDGPATPRFTVSVAGVSASFG